MALLLSLIAFTCMYATSPDLNRNKSGGTQVAKKNNSRMTSNF